MNIDKLKESNLCKEDILSKMVKEGDFTFVRCNNLILGCALGYNVVKVWNLNGDNICNYTDKDGIFDHITSENGFIKNNSDFADCVIHIMILEL